MNPKLGPTGEFPHGMLGPSDHGALQVGVAHDSKGNVIISFGVEVSWIGFPPDQAIHFAKNLLKHAGASKVMVEFGTAKPGEDH